MIGRVEVQRPREPIGDQARAQPTLERQARREVSRQRQRREDVNQPGAFGEHASRSNHAHAGHDHPFARDELDRAGERRKQPQWIDATLAAPDARGIVLGRREACGRAALRR